MVPFDTRSPMVTSGIRLGTAALTTKGMKESEMKMIAGFINRVLSNVEDENVHKNVLEEVKELAGQFPLYDF
jgi:glycine hydroxymethyltransferase